MKCYLDTAYLVLEWNISTAFGLGDSRLSVTSSPLCPTCLSLIYIVWGVLSPPHQWRLLPCGEEVSRHAETTPHPSSFKHPGMCRHILWTLERTRAINKTKFIGCGFATHPSHITCAHFILVSCTLYLCHAHYTCVMHIILV